MASDRCTYVYYGEKITKSNLGVSKVQPDGLLIILPAWGSGGPSKEDLLVLKLHVSSALSLVLLCEHD